MGVSRAILVVLAVLSTPARVSIAVQPTVVLQNGTIRITCTVPRHPDNRWLTIAVPGYTSSTRQLDGADEKITHTMYVQHIPCDIEGAICEVTDALGRTYPVARPVVVAGCAQSSSDR